MNQGLDHEHAELFRHMMNNMNMTAERRPNGNKIFTYETQGTSGEGKKILDYYREIRDKRSKDERYAEYLRLKNEFEGVENAD